MSTASNPSDDADCAPPHAPGSLLQRPWVRGGLLTAGIVVTLVVINFVQFGKGNSERLLTELALPFGLLWLVLTWLACTALLQPATPSAGLRPRWLFPLLWLFLTVGGNHWLARWAVYETEFIPTTSWRDALPLDYVVILGGGVSAGPDDDPVLNGDGDRVRPALQMWFSGSVGKIIVTGTASQPDRPGPAVLTEELLRSCGVPAEAIVMVQGQNTSEEMRKLHELFAESSPAGDGPKVGLVTSAFHLPRALRLAQQEGLEFIPIPAASRRSNEPIGFARSIVPNADSMMQIGMLWKEVLAKMVGR